MAQWWKSTCVAGDAGDLGSIPGLGRSPGEGNGNPLQYSCLGKHMDPGRVTKSQIWLGTHDHCHFSVLWHWASYLTILGFNFPISEMGKGLENYVLWQPGWEGSLGSMNTWVPLLSTWNHHRIVNWLYPNTWRRQWHPTPVPLPGEPHGRRGLVGCGLWGCKESDTTKKLTHTQILMTVKYKSPIDPQPFQHVAL